MRNSQEMNNATLVTIATYSFAHEAHIARARLEAEEIPVFIADEYTITMQWLYANALGGIRLQVPRPFAETAKAIIEQDYSQLLEDEMGSDETACPQCGSTEVEPYTQGKRSAFMVFLLVGFPLFFYQHGIRCNVCGKFSKV